MLHKKVLIFSLVTTVHPKEQSGLYSITNSRVENGAEGFKFNSLDQS